VLKLRKVFSFRFTRLLTGAMSLEVFSKINDFLEKNKIKRDDCNGLCTDGDQSMSGRNA
jgi:hypothetical protein